MPIQQLLRASPIASGAGFAPINSDGAGADSLWSEAGDELHG